LAFCHVEAHGRSRVDVAHGALHVADADAGDQPGGAEGAAQAVWTDRVTDTGSAGDAGQCPAGTGAVHPPPGPGTQDRAGGAPVDRFPDSAQHRDRERDVGRLGALTEHVQQFVAGLIPQVGDVGPAGLGHPQPEHAEQADQGVLIGS